MTDQPVPYDPAASIPPLAPPTPTPSAGVDAGAHDPVDPPPAPAEQQIAEALALGLAGLRAARPGFQDDLERRLLARLAEAPRPARGHASPPGRRPMAPIGWLPRRPLIGLAAAAALALVAASLAVPFVGAPEVSAREILERAQANLDNPVLAGVRSYHLTAKVWTAHPDGAPAGRPAGGPRESMTEQWFVAPDRMRTETRSTGKDGRPAISGFLVDGGSLKHYRSAGDSDVVMIGAFAVADVPPGLKPGDGGRTESNASGTRTAPIAAVPIAVGPSPGPAAPAPGAPSPAPGGWSAGVRVNVVERHGRDDGTVTETDREVVVVGTACPEPKRTGEATVAGRAVVVIENDLSRCLPDDAPIGLRGRHVRWVDRQTYLPLKMEMYDGNGVLTDRYEVTAIQYDGDIPASVFGELPPGTSAYEPLILPGPRPG